MNLQVVAHICRLLGQFDKQAAAEGDAVEKQALKKILGKYSVNDDDLNGNSLGVLLALCIWSRVHLQPSGLTLLMEDMHHSCAAKTLLICASYMYDMMTSMLRIFL